jgi:hypothetical protein
MTLYESEIIYLKGVDDSSIQVSVDFVHTLDDMIIIKMIWCPLNYSTDTVDFDDDEIQLQCRKIVDVYNKTRRTLQ